MSIQDPVELYKSAATSAVARVTLFLGTGGLATWLGGLCAAINPTHFSLLFRPGDMDEILAAIIMLPLAWLAGLIYATNHLFGIVNLAANALIAYQLLYRQGSKLNLLWLLSTQSLAVFLAYDRHRWLAWVAIATLCMSNTGCLYIAWILQRARHGQWVIHDDPASERAREHLQSLRRRSDVRRSETRD